MKKGIIVLLFLLGSIVLYTWHFPLWFKYVLSAESRIDVVIKKLGEPDEIVMKPDFHEEIISNDKNQSAEKVYYWSNGMSSYHYVVTNANGEIINYSSVGW